MATERVGKPDGRRKRGLKRISVVPIDPAKYPQFQADANHMFVGLSETQRLEEIDEFLARWWLRTNGGTKAVQRGEAA